MKRGAFFIDKDGVLVDNSRYPEIIPTDELLENDIFEGLKHIQNKGYKIIIVSNQKWISKGLMKREDVEKTFQIIIKKLKEKGIEINDYFYCPHKEEDNCNCRKPSPKMILDAAEKHSISLKDSFMIGDMEKDIESGKNAGTKTILVLTGRGKDYQNETNADYVINNLNEINKVIK